jgi:hypothetical protein
LNRSAAEPFHVIVCETRELKLLRIIPAMVIATRKTDAVVFEVGILEAAIAHCLDSNCSDSEISAPMEMLSSGQGGAGDLTAASTGTGMRCKLQERHEPNE